MKKRTKKGTSSKRSGTKQPSAAAAADQDIAGLLTMLVQKLTSFEAKIDTVLSRIPPQPSIIAPSHPPPSIPLPEQRREPRPMYKAICADCGNGCEVPFKPSGDRPVYCKKCFAIRRKNGTFKPRGDRKPQEAPRAPVQPSEKPAAATPPPLPKKAKPVAKKKGKGKKHR